MKIRKKFSLPLGKQKLELGERTLVMGVLNVTPDSFSDGGKFFALELAVDGALAMQRDGADILDVGAETTKPGSAGISEEEEIARLLPVLHALRGRLTIPISIDTQKATVAEMALRNGAAMLNDVSGLQSDARMATVAAHFRVPIVLMHMRGVPRTMQHGAFAKNVIADVTSGLRHAVRTALRSGVKKSQIILDPGIGFGKSYAQNFELLEKLPELTKLGYPLMVGTSRKGFLGAALQRSEKNAEMEDRIWGTAATVTASILHGAHIVRVHDVAQMAHVARIADCILNPRLRPKDSKKP